MSFLDEWKSGQTAVPKSEVQYFRFFARLMSEHFNDVHYYEVHGNPGHVLFNSALWPTKPPVTKELGDLIIITYSQRDQQARYTINQNKFKKNSGHQRDWPTFKFKADIHQYDLLAFRPDIKPVGSIKFPSQILSGTDYDSVGSYGVFYEGKGHLIDFIYSIAKWLSPQSFVNSCNLILNTCLDEMSANNKETICTVGIETFVKHLLNMRIGAPVCSSQLGGFLNSLIQRAAQEVGEEPPIIDIPIFNESLDIDDPIANAGYRLLIINTDQNT